MVRMRRPGRAVAAAVAVGVSFDVLFWDALPGVNLSVFLALAIVVTVATAHAAGRRPGSQARCLLVGALLVGLLPTLRTEPTTAAVAALAGLGLLAVAVQALPRDDWLRWGLFDHAVAGWDLAIGVAVGPFGLARATAERVQDGDRARLRRGIPVLRGVGVSVPLLVFFSVLLGAADPVFAARLDGALAWLRPAAVDEFALRAAIVTAVATATAGLIWQAAVRPRPALVTGSVPGPRLGATEATIVLGSIDLLFASFLAVQLRATLGGTAYLATQDLTYAEWARRGFGELVVVAAASLLVLVAVAGLTRTDDKRARSVITGLAAALTGLVGVLLASAFRRLLLYEAAFGFTRERLLAHLLMLWLGLLFAALLVLVVRAQLRRFTVVCVVAATGFVLTLGAINVDGLIVNRNVARALNGAELDTAYLASLSPDAVPSLADAAVAAPPALRQRLDDVLACHARALAEPRGWQGWSLGRWRADRAIYSWGSRSSARTSLRAPTCSRSQTPPNGGA